MAKLLAKMFAVENNKGIVTRTSNHALNISVGGWDTGIEVNAYIGPDGMPEFLIRRTGGSNNPKPLDMVYQLAATEGKEEPELQEPQVVRPFEEIRISFTRTPVVVQVIK